MTDRGPNTTGPSELRRMVRNFLFLLAGLVGVLGLAAVLMDERGAVTSGPVIQLTPPYKLRLAAVLGGPHNEYPAQKPMTLRERLVAWMPKSLQRMLGARRATHHNVFRTHSPHELKVVFAIDSTDPEWQRRSSLAQPDLERLRRSVSDAMTSGSGSHQSRLRGFAQAFGGRFKTSTPQLYAQNHFYAYSGPGGRGNQYDPHVELHLGQIPASIEDMELVVQWHSYNAEDQATTVAVLPIRNPGFQPVVPLKEEGPLPIRKKNGNLEVELVHVVNGTSTNYLSERSVSGKTGEELLREGRFLKHRPTKNSNAGSAIVFRVRENDTLTTGWALEQLKMKDSAGVSFSYGSSESHIPGEPGLYAVAGYGDITWYPGALDMDLQLYRKTAQPADEIHSFTFEVPPAGEYRPVRQSFAFWNTSATLEFVGHKYVGPLPGGSLGHALDGLNLALSRAGVSGQDTFKILDVTWHSTTESQKLENRGHSMTSNNRLIQTMHSYVPSWQDRERNMDTPVSATLTMLSPRLRNFSFRVLPVPATEEPAPEKNWR